VSAIDRKRLWRYVRGLAGPVLLWALVLLTLRQPLWNWLRVEDTYDQEAMQEWVREAVVSRLTLPELVGKYKGEVAGYARAFEANAGQATPGQEEAVTKARQAVADHLMALGTPSTKVYPGQLPLFPVIYRLEVRLNPVPTALDWMNEPIVWDSQLPRGEGQYSEQRYVLAPDASVILQYQLHAYDKRQRDEQHAAERRRWVLALAVAGTAVAFAWLWLVHHRERERERQRQEAQQAIEQKERLLLQEEVRRQEAELRQEDAERKLLEQRLATEAVEREALELKSQLYASIGIMAGSYAHNIKNLLVRPNDLLRRLETNGLDGDQERMLREVRQTLGTVTERLQQILRTVRRDPSKSELAHIDLNEVARDITRTWKDLARDKWKLDLTLELDSSPGPLFIQGDPSHLQQAAENLLFNARDATFEMRNHLRAKARGHESGIRNQESGVRDQESEPVRQALIAAAGWRGQVVVRTRRSGDRAVLEVQDNGVGMSEEVRRRCTETHFSTKRDNALYEGAAAGMGLGLSFVVVILEHHGAKLEIESAPLRGTTFRASLPIAAGAT
jgi:signal transduction histidine kinase